MTLRELLACERFCKEKPLFSWCAAGGGGQRKFDCVSECTRLSAVLWVGGFAWDFVYTSCCSHVAFLLAREGNLKVLKVLSDAHTLAAFGAIQPQDSKTIKQSCYDTLDASSPKSIWILRVWVFSFREALELWGRRKPLGKINNNFPTLRTPRSNVEEKWTDVSGYMRMTFDLTF